MELRKLGTTSLRIAPLALGAGPVPQLMTDEDSERQRAVFEHAIECGIHWVDTAATYGMGKSEAAIGKLLCSQHSQVQIATKVRINEEGLHDIAGFVRRSLEQSLQRLNRSQVTLLQLHNSITSKRADQPTSVTPHDVLQSRGILAAMEQLRDEGLVEHLGLTGIGDPASLRDVLRSGRVESLQIPFNVLNPSAGFQRDDDFADANYANLLADCLELNVGVFPIRVFAGGALLNAVPSPHTSKTPFFPLEIYRQDCQRATQMQDHFGWTKEKLKSVALRFTIFHAAVSAVIIGFSRTEHIDDAVAAYDQGPLESDLVHRIATFPQ